MNMTKAQLLEQVKSLQNTLTERDLRIDELEDNVASLTNLKRMETIAVESARKTLDEERLLNAGYTEKAKAREKELCAEIDRVSLGQTLNFGSVSISFDPEVRINTKAVL